MKHIRNFALILMMLPIVAMAAGTEIYTGQVVKIADGDTFTLLVNGHDQIKVRLDGIDCPEKGQAFGNKAKEYLSSMIWGEIVTVKVSKYDRYGRAIGTVSTAKFGNVNLEMIKGGMAWQYREYNNDPTYKAAEDNARLQRKGLWQDPNPIYPQDFRKAKRNKNKQQRFNWKNW